MPGASAAIKVTTRRLIPVRSICIDLSLITINTRSTIGVGFGGRIDTGSRIQPSKIKSKGPLYALRGNA